MTSHASPCARREWLPEKRAPTRGASAPKHRSLARRCDATGYKPYKTSTRSSAYSRGDVAAPSLRVGPSTTRTMDATETGFTAARFPTMYTRLILCPGGFGATAIQLSPCTRRQSENPCSAIIIGRAALIGRIKEWARALSET